MSENVTEQLAGIERRMAGLEALLREIKTDLAALRSEKDTAKRRYRAKQKKDAAGGDTKPHRAPSHKKTRNYPKF